MPASVNQPPSPHRTPLVHRLSNVRVLGSAPTSWCAASTFFSQQSPSCSAHRSLLKHPTHTAQPSVASQLAEQAAASDCLLCGPTSLPPRHTRAQYCLPASTRVPRMRAPHRGHQRLLRAPRTPLPRPQPTAQRLPQGAPPAQLPRRARALLCARATRRRTHTVQNAAAGSRRPMRTRRAAARATRAARAPSPPLIARLGGRALRGKVRGRRAGCRRAQPAGATHSGPRTQRWRSPRLPTHVSIFCAKFRLPAAPS